MYGLKTICLTTSIAVIVGCQPESSNDSFGKSLGEEDRSFVRLDHAFNALVPQDAMVEKIAGGFQFTEGPVWVPGEPDALLFSDISANTVYQWTELGGSEVFLHPVTVEDSDSGGTGGSNGLALDLDGRLVLCEHGNRRIARMGANGSRTTLVERYNELRLNSPNDIVFHSSGAAFFTDPPFGLEGADQSPAKEQPHNGIYRLDPDGTITLVAAGQTYPNGIGLSPDERTLYVANADGPPNRVWMSYPVRGDLGLDEGTVFFDGNDMEEPGWADGLALDKAGNIYATGPGGVLVIDPNGRHLGTIRLDEIATNVGWGDDGNTLYITAHTSVYRITLEAAGLVHYTN